MSLRWRIYYDDGSVFSSEDGHAKDAPARGVIAIAQATGCDHHPLMRLKTGEPLHGYDWYWWREDLACWLTGTIDGMLDQMMHCDARWVKQGRMTSHAKWEGLWNAITTDGFSP